jgi:hypothetical protein
VRVWMATDGSRRYGVIKKVSANGQIASDALSVIIVLDLGHGRSRYDDCETWKHVESIACG